jgi:hypothetical protein
MSTVKFISILLPSVNLGVEHNRPSSDEDEAYKEENDHEESMFPTNGLPSL